MIQHRTARRIASEWHGGQSTGLYALCSSGAIIGKQQRPGETETEEEVCACLRWLANNRTMCPVSDQQDLTNLLAYIKHYGPRGPVPGWNDMP